jgi:hypothetical protein
VDVTDFFAFNAETGRFEGVVLLRAERAGGGDGRTYTIEATVMNADLNSATSRCAVIVPHDDSELAPRLDPLQPWSRLAEEVALKIAAKSGGR